jgi:hypothetical protein
VTEGTAAPAPAASVPPPAVLSEWWAPSQPVHGEHGRTHDDLAVMAEWVAVGTSAPDPPSPVPDEIDLASVAEWSALPVTSRVEPDLATLPEWSTLPVGAAELERSLALAEAAAVRTPPMSRIERTRAEGTFAVTGLALASGHLVFEGITFATRLSRPPRPERVRLTMSAEDNVAPGGLVVMADAGFGPDTEGFTLVLAAAEPGRFHARGRYEVELD